MDTKLLSLHPSGVLLIYRVNLVLSMDKGNPSSVYMWAVTFQMKGLGRFSVRPGICHVQEAALPSAGSSLGSPPRLDGDRVQHAGCFGSFQPQISGPGSASSPGRPLHCFLGVWALLSCSQVLKCMLEVTGEYFSASPPPSPASALSLPSGPCTACQRPSSGSLSGFVRAMAACWGLETRPWCPPSAWPWFLFSTPPKGAPFSNQACAVQSVLCLSPLPLLPPHVLSGRPSRVPLWEAALLTVLALRVPPFPDP